MVCCCVATGSVLTVAAVASLLANTEYRPSNKIVAGIVTTGIAVSSVVAYTFLSHTNNECHEKQQNYEFLDIQYLQPTKFSSTEHKIIDQGTCMIGTEGKPDLLKARESGGQIFGQGGLDIISCNKGLDIIYFSTCETKVINNKTSIIENFGTGDKIRLFCSKRLLSKDDVLIKHDDINDIYFILIAGKFEPTAVAIEKPESPITMENIELNSVFDKVICLGETTSLI